MGTQQGSPSAKTRVRVEQGVKRVRAYLGGRVVVDSLRSHFVWENPSYPTYYFPLEDVRAELVHDGPGKRSPSRGDSTAYTVKVDGADAPGAALRYEDSPVEELRGLVRLDWNAMDSWFEEDEEVFVHPRSPYTRVDILPSSRHIRVEVAGVTVAESSNARLLFETGLPVRYYLPKPDVRMDLLEATETTTGCPYKGWAHYWAIRAGGDVHPDLAWGYSSPLPEGERVGGMVCFYNEKVDIYVDGVREERPKTKFS
ncbi:DUF427 domain-containing protein [Actinomadura barringtoniae]|uniref:DUF427 domain-containing protein n=1 Tax=Actinomadura barringtoniae TaxID=1427535 RepID=A0A939PLZ1_9ACTN|nr:DUF427 domain-containing protein [Actinomadura barringtoniae]MBO2451594.1 DUF427 domain-containing protein [Actinomadura barringtoniae]